MLSYRCKEEMDTQTTRKVVPEVEILAGGYLAETGSLQGLAYLFMKGCECLLKKSLSRYSFKT